LMPVLVRVQEIGQLMPVLVRDLSWSAIARLVESGGDVVVGAHRSSHPAVPTCYSASEACLRRVYEIRGVRLDQRVQQRALGCVARVMRSGVGSLPWRVHLDLPPGCGEARHAALRCRDGCSGLRS
jgi:hypothetical protein